MNKKTIYTMALFVVALCADVQLMAAKKVNKSNITIENTTGKKVIIQLFRGAVPRYRGLVYNGWFIVEPNGSFTLYKDTQSANKDSILHDLEHVLVYYSKDNLLSHERSALTSFYSDGSVVKAMIKAIRDEKPTTFRIRQVSYPLDGVKFKVDVL